MKDCSTCEKRPAAGERYEDTECFICKPWEPTDSQCTVKMEPKATLYGSAGMLIALLEAADKMTKRQWKIFIYRLVTCETNRKVIRKQFGISAATLKRDIKAIVTLLPNMKPFFS